MASLAPGRYINHTSWAYTIYYYEDTGHVYATDRPDDSHQWKTWEGGSQEGTKEKPKKEKKEEKKEEETGGYEEEPEIDEEEEEEAAAIEKKKKEEEEEEEEERVVSRWEQIKFGVKTAVKTLADAISGAVIGIGTAEVGPGTGRAIDAQQKDAEDKNEGYDNAGEHEDGYYYWNREAGE